MELEEHETKEPKNLRLESFEPNLDCEKQDFDAGEKKESVASRKGDLVAFSSQDNLPMNDKPPEEVKWNTFGYGLYLHFLFQGFVLKTLFSIIYPFYANYLNLDGHQYRAASTLPLAAWSLKTIIGVVSDVWPISGQRRRPYMILGMGLSFIPLAIITFKPVPKPYYEPVYANGTCFLNKETVYNADAKQEGIQYVVINTLAFMLLSFADVAADGLKIEYSQKETAKRRGSINVIIYMFIEASTICSIIVTGFLMNGVEYGGTFCFSISYKTLSAVMSAMCFVAVINGMFLVHDQKLGAVTSVKQQFRAFWAAFQSREVLQVFIVLFFWAMSIRISSPAGVKVKKNWAKVTPLITTFSQFIATGLEILGVWILKKFFLHASWRKIFLFSRIVHLITDNVVEFLTIYDIVRNPYFYFADDVISAIPEGMGHLVGGLMLIEICPKGLEALFHSLLVTSFIVGMIIGTPIANVMTTGFDVSTDTRYFNDTAYDRNMVALSFAVTLFVQVVSIPLLLLLPSQKEDIEQLKAKKQYFPKLAAIFLSAVIFFFLVSFLMSIATLIPQLSCLEVLGGRGCESSSAA
ncbi:folate-biopterin transporter-like isoform X2 [Convolutriloba macropyga]|uniref:folate-biopterin transporter-like isoform X2 n=1 Tax=Convolutriloba macropyga TaxID=536237 RepID=UPI003F51CE59